MITDRFRIFSTPIVLIIVLWMLFFAAARLDVPGGLRGERCLLPAMENTSFMPLRITVSIVGLAMFAMLPGWLLLQFFSIPLLVRIALSGIVTSAVWMIVRPGFLILSVEPTRMSMTFFLSVWIIAMGALLAYTRKRVTIPRSSSIALLVLVGILVLVLFGAPKLIIENFSGDGVEAYSFAESLDASPLPTWDLENGTWGFYPAFMSFAYFLHLSILFIGRCEAAARLPVFIIAVSIAGILINGRRGLLEKILFGVTTVLFIVVSGWNYTYDPYFADITEPTVTDAFFALSVVGALWCWYARQTILFGICAFVAATAQPAGVPFLFIFLFLQILMNRGNRQHAIRNAFILGIVVVGIYTLAYLYNPPAESKFSALVFLRHHSDSLITRFGIRQVGTQVFALLIQIGIVPVFFIPAVIRRFRTEVEFRPLLITCLVYGIAIIISPKRHAHYLTPFVVFLLFSLPGKLPKRSLISWLVASCACIFLSIPGADCTVDTRSREFGEATIRLFQNEPDAVDNADMLYSQMVIPPWRDDTIWGIGKHAWILYSRDHNDIPEYPADSYHLVFSPKPVNDSRFHYVTDNTTSFLYERPRGWLEKQKNRGGTTTCWGPIMKVPHRLWDPLSRWKS